MKKVSFQFILALFAIIAFLASCSQENVNPVAQDAAVYKKEGDKKSTQAITYTVKRYIFQRPNGANGLGHVGVGFEVRHFNGSTTPFQITYYYGAVENYSASFIVPRGGNNGGWWKTASTGAAMFNTMKNAPYNYVNYKYTTSFASVTQTGWVNGVNKISDFPQRGYSLAGNNCMNATYDVLMSFGVSGASVAWPSTNYFPNGWYNNTTVGWSASTAL